MNKNRRFVLIILISVAGSILLSACALRSMFGNVIFVEDIENEVNEIITTVFSDSTAAVCLDSDYGFYECTYIIDGDIITSTLYLLSEFGLTGVLIDPVIVQLPADYTGLTATYDLGSGPLPLVAHATTSFLVTPDITVTAETGQIFVILELPAAVESTLPSGDPDNGLEVSYFFEFTRVQPIQDPVNPVSVKVMLAGKVVVNEHTYYVPTLPCVTDFASLPSIEIPLSATPVSLQATLGDLIRNGGSDVVCDHHGYYYNIVPPPPLKVFLPLTVR